MSYCHKLQDVVIRLAGVWIRARWLTLAGFTVPVAVHGMPRDLVIGLKDQQCQPVANFFQRDGRIDPDFLNRQDGRRDKDAAWSSVAWCQRSTGGRIEYSLMFFKDGLPLHRDGCPYRIDVSSPPRGLSIHWTRMPLVDFSALNGGAALKGAGSTSYAPLVDSHDGQGTAYYCHQRQWYSAPLD